MQLSQEQQTAAHCESPKALVLAPAGSGKTRVLIARIVHLLSSCGISPYEILDFTFTRKASGELKTRLIKEIGGQAHKIRTGTFHGVALKLIQTYGELVGLRPDKITVYGNWEEQFLLKEVAKELGYHSGHKWTKVKAGEVEAAFKLFYTTGHITTDAVSVKVNVLMNAFFARCKENNALTYGTILTTFLRLIPKISQYLNLRHVLVDEIQDQNPIQWEIINQLCELCGADLFVIGDIRQAIYGFNGADTDYLIRNEHLFDVYNLRDNYRSSANIVEAANKLIAHNPMDLGESMRAKREGLNVSIQHLTSMDSSTIVDMLRVNENKNIAVLSRVHGLLKKLSRLLNDAGIKHEYIGKKSGLVRSEEFRRFHSFLKLILNEHDNFSFLLIKEYLGVTPEEYGQIRVDAVERSISHIQAWRNTDTSDPATWQKEFHPGLDIHEIVDLLKIVEFQFDPDEIFTFIYSWIIENPAGTIAQYLNWLATFDISDEMKEESEGLQLMTVHASKGLEFSTVIAIGLNEGIFPDKRDIKANDLVDARRLFYVLTTRAENQLIYTSRPIKDKYDKVQPVSRFISESLSN